MTTHPEYKNLAGVYIDGIGAGEITVFAIKRPLTEALLHPAAGHLSPLSWNVLRLSA